MDFVTSSVEEPAMIHERWNLGKLPWLHLRFPKDKNLDLPDIGRSRLVLSVMRVG
jgi:hypothetical protein